MAFDLGTAVGYLELDTTKFTKPLNEAQKGFSSFNDKTLSTKDLSLIHISPEESDLLSSGVANVSITDTGVAITTMPKSDPVNVETKVSMISLPSFEAADQIFIADVANP